MTVTELMQELVHCDPNMEIYVSTSKSESVDIVDVDENFYGGHGKYRGVYLTLDESEYERQVDE